jgi:pyridoxamine 5'-phosphate oxidase
VFYTNYSSAKARDLEANPTAALVFYWSQFDRQVRVQGVVEHVTPEESQAYFRTRPRESQIGAWASPQSEVIENRETLEARVAELEELYGDREIECPEHWGGYRLKPTRIEFWKGRLGRLHDRIVYERDGAGWKISRLAP